MQISVPSEIAGFGFPMRYSGSVFTTTRKDLGIFGRHSEAIPRIAKK
jgi:hypothetical protein